MSVCAKATALLFASVCEFDGLFVPSRPNARCIELASCLELSMHGSRSFKASEDKWAESVGSGTSLPRLRMLRKIESLSIIRLGL